jgi:uncharacterized membrane protein YgdD (TMEM256/DUF423 family)
MPTRIFLLAAGLFGAAGVAMGAHGSHGGFEAAAAAQIHVASTYLLLHATALAALAALASQGRYARAPLRLCGFCLTLGTLLFSSSLYLHHALHWPTRLAPAGGGLLILGWIMLVTLPLWRRRNHRRRHGFLTIF